MTVVGPFACPKCDKVVAQGKPMQSHLRDAHGMDAKEAHLIANPNDTHASRSGAVKAHNTENAQRRHGGRPPRMLMHWTGGKRPADDFDVLEGF
jgi:hypothetical protein